jgi:hypothetical protein
MTFSSNNLARGVFASLLQHPTITCKHSGSRHYIMPSYKAVHLGLVRTRMNCDCVRLVNMGTQSKLLLQLPSTPQVLVFLLEYHTWNVKKCLDKPNTR